MDLAAPPPSVPPLDTPRMMEEDMMEQQEQQQAALAAQAAQAEPVAPAPPAEDQVRSDLVNIHKSDSVFEEAKKLYSDNNGQGTVTDAFKVTPKPPPPSMPPPMTFDGGEGSFGMLVKKKKKKKPLDGGKGGEEGKKVKLIITSKKTLPAAVSKAEKEIEGAKMKKKKKVGLMISGKPPTINSNGAAAIAEAAARASSFKPRKRVPVVPTSLQPSWSVFDQLEESLKRKAEIDQDTSDLLNDNYDEPEVGVEEGHVDGGDDWYGGYDDDDLEDGAMRFDETNMDEFKARFEPDVTIDCDEDVEYNPEDDYLDEDEAPLSSSGKRRRKKRIKLEEDSGDDEDDEDYGAPKKKVRKTKIKKEAGEEGGGGEGGGKENETGEAPPKKRRKRRSKDTDAKVPNTVFEKREKEGLPHLLDFLSLDDYVVRDAGASEVKVEEVEIKQEPDTAPPPEPPKITIKTEDGQEKQIDDIWAKEQLILEQREKKKREIQTAKANREAAADRKIYGCVFCRYTGRKQNWIHHLKKGHADKKIFFCSSNRTCNTPFSSQDTMNEHVQKFHKNKPAMHCEICNREFKYPSMLRNHMQSHKEIDDADKQFHICPYCGKKFNTRTGYRSHEAKYHTGALNHKCEFEGCGKAFFNHSDLIIHNRVHTGELPYVCSYCGAGFVARPRLTQHEKVMHTMQGKMDAECEICHKVIRRKNLPFHIKTHKGLTKAWCSVCGKEFQTTGGKRRHEKIHFDVKPYACRFCGKAFVQKANMEAHERIHTGEKPYSCKFCGECFVQGTRRNQHQNGCRQRNLFNNPPA